MPKRRRSTAAVLFALPLGLAAVAVPLPAAAADILETLRNTGQSDQFEIEDFGTALEASGLADQLKGGGPYTVFAPTDQALTELEPAGTGPQATAKTPEQQFESADKERLADVLKAHIVEGELPFEELIKQEKLETLGGTELQVTSAKGGVLVNDIEVLHSDITADNGVIHVIGGLLTSEGEDETGPDRQE